MCGESDYNDDLVPNKLGSAITCLGLWRNSCFCNQILLNFMFCFLSSVGSGDVIAFIERRGSNDFFVKYIFLITDFTPNSRNAVVDCCEE